MKPEAPKTTPTPPPPEQAKREAAKKPSKDDIHEQREDGQVQEGVVETSPRKPQQSQIDAERSDWEGMGQARHQPEEDEKPTSH